MKNYSFFYNDRYSVLNYLYAIEEPSKDSSYSKCSQEEIAEELNMSKTTANRLINELIENNYLKLGNTRGSYHITQEGHIMINDLNEKQNKEKASKYNCISLFAGVGGIELGFHNAGFPTIYANEFDRKAADTFEYNFGLKVDCRDVRLLANDIQNNLDVFNGKKVDILLAGFPCQAFSIAGYRQGFNDEKGRGDLFFEIMRIAEKTNPEVIFLENVKNLKMHDKGRTFKIIKKTLEDLGYHVHSKVLNSMEYGNVPQNRERIYIVAFKDEKQFNEFHFPTPIPLTNTLHHVIDFDKQLDKRFYYTKEKFSHYDELAEAMTSQDTVYQWRRVYVRENKTGVCPTLTANMGTGGHNVPLVLTNTGIRKLTPKECFSLQGYPESYKLPENMALSALYKQAGNSVSVTVIQRIAEQILKVL
ncbi:DNA (cytosine-5-)-methyltransferase [uncultured Dubosiella sp.]|uniref:DNA (cytosine-5-)-methyltransferase n=1 Tax=uncultured Dubosiella sp. TaxID=1937011 RepID=UPI00272F6A9B|nr:DNA (cytosine-5-)-methyltransferase [uncultured Dubosiella sp.]